MSAPVQDNSDLIGQTYRSPPHGPIFRVTGIDEHMPALVFVERLMDKTPGSAVAEFVRMTIADEAKQREAFEDLPVVVHRTDV